MFSPEKFLKSNQPFVQTVRGPIAPEELGTMMVHEHLIADWPWATGKEKDRFETLGVIEWVLECLKKANADGVTALLDCGMERYGPSPLALLCIALQTPVHILCTTGVFAQDLLPMPNWVHLPYGPADIARRFIDAATHGVDGSGVKPGAIKVASSADGITPLERNAFRAAAQAQRATGLAITTHSWLTMWIEEQVNLFEELGADLDRVVIGHIGWGTTVKDSALHRRVAKRGVNMAVDCVGSPARTLEENADIVMDLLDAGHAKQILFSHDQTAYARGILEIFKGETGWFTGDFATAVRELIPLLRKRGVDEKTLEGFLVDNPRRVFTVDPKRYPGAKTTLLHKAPFNHLAGYEYDMVS